MDELRPSATLVKDDPAQKQDVLVISQTPEQQRELSRFAGMLLGQVAPSANPGVQNKDVCDTLAQPKDMKDAVASAQAGDSTLHRIFEVGVLTPQGTVTAAGMDSVYGAPSSAKLQQLGVTKVTRSGTHTEVELAKPVHVGDSGGALDIAKIVSFDASQGVNSVYLSGINGVQASSGWLSAPVRDASLTPRVNGYLSGTATAGWGATGIPFVPPSISGLTRQVSMCAFPDGRIFY